MPNSKLVNKFIWTIGSTLLVGITGTAGSILWSTNAMQAQLKFQSDYSTENRQLIRDNKKSIEAINTNGQYMIKQLTDIATSMKYIEKSGDSRNKILLRVALKTDKTAEIQASRTSDVKSIRPTINQLNNHISSDKHKR